MKMKKILALLLSCMLILGSVPFALAANGTAVSVQASTTEVTPGEEVTFDVVLSGAESIRGIEVHLAVSDGLTVVDFARVSSPDAWLASVNKEALGLAYAGDEVYAFTGDMTLARLTCTVDEDASGTLSVSVVSSEVADIEKNPVAHSANGATVTVHNHDFGSEWKYDDEQHWHECECGDKDDVAAHTWSAWSEDTATCIEPGEKSRECTICGKSETVKTDPTGNHIDEDGDNKCDKCEQVLCKDGDHVEETVYGYPATCTEPGLTDGVKCSTCGEILVPQKEIPALGHNWQYENGNLVCGTCGEVMYIDDNTDVTVDENGTIIITATLEDGTVVITYKYITGVRVIVTLSPEGAVVSVVIDIPSKVSNEAVRNDEPVVLPMDEIVEKHGNIDQIAVVIKTNCDKLVPVAYAVDNVKPGHVIMIVGEDGTETVVPTTKMTENGLVFYCADGVAVKVVYNAKNFTDIKDGKWYNDAVDFVSAREIMTGRTDTTFAPTETTTRAEVWTMLARLAGVDTTCTEGNWYDVARAWAMENDISDGERANDSISRQEMVTMLYRFVGGKGVSKSIADFSDAADASDWAKAALEWAYGMGVMNGNTDGTMNPKGNATRAEMAQFFMNFIQNI